MVIDLACRRGENSTGKTSFMALIRILWDAVYDNASNFREPPFDLGSFDEIAHNRGKGGQVDKFEAGFYAHRRNECAGDGGQPYHFDVTFARNGADPVPVKRRLSGEDVWIENSIKEDLFWDTRFGTDTEIWQQSRELEGLTNLDSLLPFYPGQNNNFKTWLQQALAAGRASNPNSITARRTEELKKAGVCQSDDAHVIALAQVSNARLLYTRDRNLQQDFKNKGLLDNPRGKIYSAPSHKHLLRKGLCRRSS